MNPQLAYIFKSQIFDKMPNVAERDVASIAKKWVGTAARPGRFLRESSLFFLSRESGGVKGQMLLPPGATSLERAQMGEKGLQTENRPVIIPEYDYPGLPFEKLADFVATQAVLALRAEREGSRLGPDLSQLVPAQPLTEVNSLDESGAIDTELIELQREMYIGYSQRVIDYLWNRLKNTSLRHLGYSSANGRTGSWEANGGIKVGIMGDKPDTVVQMKIKPLRLKNRTAYQFEVRESIEQVKKNLEAEGYAVLSMFTGADYLMHVTKGKTTPLTSAEVYQDLVESGCKMVGNISSKKGVWAAKDLKYQSIKFTKESFIGDSKLPFVFPLSLHIMPPSTKSSKTNPNEGSNFFSPTESSGYVILPFDASVPIKEGYDNHPQVVDYRAAEIMPMIQSFYATAGILEPLVSPSISLIEETTSTQSADYLMTVRRNLPRSLELEEVEGAEIVQVWNDGVECALAAGELSLPGGVTLTNLPQTYEASVLAPKDVVSGVLVGETKESIFGLIEESRDIIDEAHNFELLTRWGELTFLAHTSPNQQIVGKLMGNTVRPARYGTAKSASEIHYDEVIRGNADGLMALFEDGTRGIAYAAQTIDTAVIAFDIEGKRAKNGEIGNVLLGVLSNERRALELETGKITRKEEIFSPVATLGSWVGFSVEARRNMIEHLSEHITHIEDGMAFVNPYSANVIVRVEHKGITDPTDKPVYRLYQREVPFEGPKFPGKSSGDPKLRLLQFGGKPDSIDAGAAVLKLHDERLVPNIRGGKIIGLVSIVSGLEDMVGAEVKKVSPEYSRTGKGAESRFLTGIPYAQIKINQPRPRRRQEPFNPFAVQTMSKADKYRDEVALLQNQIPAEPNHKFNCGVCSYCTANPNKTSHWHEDHRNGRIYSSHFLLRLGERAMPGNAARGNYVEYINGNITLDEYMKAANRVARVSAFPKNAPKVPKYELVNSKVRPSFAYNKFRSYFNNPRPAEIEINPVYYDSGISYSPFRAESFSNLVLDNPMSPMIARGSALMSFVYHEAGDVLAAQLYKDEAAAKADKTRFLKACKANLEEKYGPIELQTIARTNVCLKKGGKVGNIHNCGSPYLSTQVKQTRSADEGETTFIHCNLCLGKDEEKGRNNPPPKVMITVPHASMDSDSNWIEHCTDWSAVPFALDIRDKLNAKGATTTLLLSDTPRQIVDFNRIAAAETDFHKYLDKNIDSYDLLLDIHSFPDHYPAWKGYDIVLFTNDDEMPEHCIEDVLDLADHLGSYGLKVLVDQADTRNYIQIKASQLGLRSHLIEVNENLGTDTIAELIAEYFAFDTQPIRPVLDNPSKTPKGRKIPKKYLKGLNREEMMIAAREIDKGYKYDIDDPEAYEEWKSDIKAKARGYKTVPSKYKKKFVEMYGPLPEKGDFITKISKATGIKKSILKEVEKKGLAAWRTGHRVGANQHAWARGRVYSFVTVGNTVKKGNKKMGDYQLAVEAGLIKNNPHIPNDFNSSRINLFPGEAVFKYPWLAHADLIKTNPRDYEEEYRKYGSSKEAIEYRSELNKYNREQGTYGNNDGLDASHIDGEIVGFEDESINRGRREKSRLKKDNPHGGQHRVPKKYEGQDPSEHSDLFTDEDPKGTIKGLGFKDKKTAIESIKKIEKSKKPFAHKMQAAMAMEQRARFHAHPTRGIKAAQKVYAKWIEDNKRSNPPPKPRKKGNRKEPAKAYIQRFMGDPKMNDEFPNASQRYAVGLSYIEKFYGKAARNRVAPPRTNPANISYSGVVLTPESRSTLLSMVEIPEGWKEVAHHMTITLGELKHPKGKHDFSSTYPLGSKIQLQGVSFGMDDRVMALKVMPPHPVSKKTKFPHVTVAVNEEAGGKPFHSNQLDDSLFTPIDITLHGEVKEIAFAQNPPAKGLTWKTGLWELPIPKDTGSKMSASVLGKMYILDGTDENGNTVSLKTNKYDTKTDYDFSNSAVASQDWLRGLGIDNYAYVIGIESSKKGIGLGQAAYLKMADIAEAVLSTNHSESAELAWSALEENAPELGYTIHRRKITYPMSKAKGDDWDGEGFRYDRVLVKNDVKSNPPRKPTVSFSKSPRKEKKMVAVFTYNDGRTKTTHFGAKGMSDYTIHKDPERKKRYITRHRKRENWDDYTSAGSLSRYILWGEPTLRASKDAYLKRFNLKEVKSNPPEGITIMSAILRFDLPRIVPLTVAVELLEDVGFVLDRWGEGYKGGGFATLLVPKSITKENVRIKIQQNSKMVMLFSGHKITDSQQKKIRQLVFDAYEMKRNPAPAPPKNVRRLSTELSKTLMGDLIPFNYKDAIKKEKEAEKKRAEAEKKRKQASKKKDPKKDDKQQGNQKKQQKPKTNPPVFAKPERISGKPGGAFISESGVDVTGRHYKGAIISAGLKRIDVDGEKEVPKPEPRSSGRRIKFNMLRPKTYDIIEGDIEKGTWLITAETSEGHIYIRDDVVVDTALTLKAFPKKKSEPRLRPETYGSIGTFFGDRVVGKIRIKSSGKEHPVFNSQRVMEGYKQNPAHAPIALSKKKALQSKMQKHNAMQKSPIRQATNGAVEEAYRRGGMNRVNRFFKMLVAKNPPDDAVLEDADLMPEGHPVKNKAESLKRQSKSSGIVKPTVEMFKQAFGFPSEGGKFAGYEVEDFDCRRIMVHRNQEYKFEWSIVLTPGKKSKAKIEREMKKFSTKKEMLPSPKRLSYEVTAANEYTIDRLESDRVVISGHGRAFRIKTNPIGELDSDGEMYINDHKPMSAKKQSSHYKREKLKGKVGSDAFMYQLAEKCQTFGEGSGYVKDGYLYYRKGSPFKNEVRVDGTMIEGATAFYHTHPAAWEPSQTSPEDFMVYHGMFTNLGMTDFFTVFGDRIDWFTFPKGEKFQPGEMAEIIEDFENDIEAVFNTSQDDFQDKMGDKPYLVPEQTRYINKMLCQCIPEYFAKYRCYELAPKNIIEAAKVNPPIETTQYHTEHLEKLDEIKPVKLAHDGNASEAWIGKKRYALSELIAARAARMVHRNNPRDQIDRRSKDWAVMVRNDMKDGMSWREARKFAKIAARRPHPAKEYTERMVVLHPDDFIGKGSTSARYYGEHDKMQMLKSYGLNDNAVKAIREYLANYTGKTSHFHILQMLNLYRNVSKIGDTDEIIDDICNIKQTDGVYSIHMDGLSCEILKKLVKDRQDLSKLENMEKSKKRHGEHFIALALHTMYHAMLSPLDSPSSAFSGMEQNDYLSTIAQNLNRTLQTAEAIAV